MCRACLSWTNCVTAAGWQELMISVAATGLMHLKAMRLGVDAVQEEGARERETEGKGKALLWIWP